MKITRLVASSSADPADLISWLQDIARTLGLPDPLPELPAQIGPDGQSVPIDPNRIVRSTVIPLEAFPTSLRPPNIDPANRSVGLTMNIRRALYTTQTGVDGEGRPTFTTQDRGWECDIATYKGPGRKWDIDLLPEIITMSVMTNGVLNWSTMTRGNLELPCTPDGWAVVSPLHPTVNYAVWQAPQAITTLPPGTP